MKRVILIIGPTASGKTALSLLLAPECRGEVVSADSRQVYRFMDIGTAKPTQSERRKVAHHLIDIIDPDTSFSAGQYGILARNAVEDIFKRDAVPIVVGGSGLYIRALVDGFFEGRYSDHAVRRQLLEESEIRGLDSLHHRLQEVDPESSQKIHPNDKRRIIRALEVYRVSGLRLSELQKKKPSSASFESQIWGLRWPRSVLYERINRRVDDMIASGFFEEVRELRKLGYDRGNISLEAVGYRDVLDYLEGKESYEETVERIKSSTRRYAKKQLTWFRKDARIRWLDTEDESNLKSHVRRILSAYHGETLHPDDGKYTSYHKR